MSIATQPLDPSVENQPALAASRMVTINSVCRSTWSSCSGYPQPLRLLSWLRAFPSSSQPCTAKPHHCSGLDT
eukprot:3940043-Rhodomonas_salina.2